VTVFTRHGALITKSIGSVIVRVLLAMLAEVNTLTVNWSWTLTMEFDGVTEMMKWADPIIKIKGINIIILLQLISNYLNYHYERQPGIKLINSIGNNKESYPNNISHKPTFTQ